MLQDLTFVDSVLPITVFDLAAIRGKFSCKNTGGVRVLLLRLPLIIIFCTLN
jgi:hypothetical protein